MNNGAKLLGELHRVVSETGVQEELKPIFGQFQDAVMMREFLDERDPFVHRAPAWMRADNARVMHRRVRDIAWEDIESGGQ